jgi:hypothetical protein
MERPIQRTGVALVCALVFGTAMTGCSSSSKSPTPDLSALAQAAANQSAGGANASSNGSAAAGGGSAAAGDGSAAANGDSEIIGDNPGCHLLSASDIKNAVGKDLPSLLGNLSKGQAGNTGHQSCTYTADETGKGADVNLEIDTFPGTAKDQLNTFRSAQQDDVDSENQIVANTATLKDISVGDGGFEADVHSAGVDDENVWFTKGDKLVNVEVGSGVRGGALQLAQEIAGKI